MKNLFKILAILIIPIYIFAHSLMLYAINNEDGTMTVSGEFSTGESATGAIVKLIALHSGEIIYQKRLVDDGLLVQIPKIPYKIVLDDGGSHITEKIGFAPPNGFEKVENTQANIQKEEKKSRNMLEISSSKAVTISIIMAFILLISTILISIKNTNKILKKMEENYKM